MHILLAILLAIGSVTRVRAGEDIYTDFPNNVRLALAQLEKLTEPTSLDALRGVRSANFRFRKAMYWINFGIVESDARFSDAGNLLRWVRRNDFRAALAQQALCRGYHDLARHGALTHANLERLRSGKAPFSASHLGEMLETDHVVPVLVAPEFANWIANLQFLLEADNLKKSGNMTVAGELKLKRLRNAASQMDRRELPVASRP